MRLNCCGDRGAAGDASIGMSPMRSRRSGHDFALLPRVYSEKATRLVVIMCPRYAVSISSSSCSKTLSGVFEGGDVLGLVGGVAAVLGGDLSERVAVEVVVVLGGVDGVEVAAPVDDDRDGGFGGDGDGGGVEMLSCCMRLATGLEGLEGGEGHGEGVVEVEVVEPSTILLRLGK